MMNLRMDLMCYHLPGLSANMDHTSWTNFFDWLFDCLLASLIIWLMNLTEYILMCQPHLPPSARSFPKHWPQTMGNFLGLADWLTDWLNDWLIDWLIDWLMNLPRYILVCQPATWCATICLVSSQTWTIRHGQTSGIHTPSLSQYIPAHLAPTQTSPWRNGPAVWRDIYLPVRRGYKRLESETICVKEQCFLEKNSDKSSGNFTPSLSQHILTHPAAKPNSHWHKDPINWKDHARM